MKVVTAEDMQRIDRYTIEEYGIPSEVLMGFAGKAVSEFILGRIRCPSRVAVFCGTGNNGGDGFLIAYFLKNRGCDVDVYVAGKRGSISKTSSVYLSLCEKSGLKIKWIQSSDEACAIDLSHCSCVVDAVLGTGFKGALRGVVADLIAVINSADAPVFSVDIPSGLPSNGGSPEGDAVRADYTATIGLPKISTVTYPGREFTGVLEVVDIGFPHELTNAKELTTELLDRDYVRKVINIKREPQVHKGEVGHLLLAGGFDGMEGAIMMSALSGFETGVGLMTLLTTAEARKIIAGKIPELITRTIGADGGPRSADAYKTEDIESRVGESLSPWLDSFFREERSYDALVLGPGMGRGLFSQHFFDVLMEKIPACGIRRVLIDGDGLFHLAGYKKRPFPEGTASIVVTPHFGEAARLLDVPVDEIKRNPFETCRELARKYSCVAVLKGPASIISDGNNSRINATGNPSLATAGSGDVLSGMVGGLLSRGLNPLDAAACGVYLHGLSADLLVPDRKDGVLSATDLIGGIGLAINNTID